VSAVSRLYRSGGKRALDVAGVLVVAPLAAPAVAIGWICAGVGSGAPGFFRQDRIGRHGTPFTLYKLRTMRDATGVQSGVTARGDDRITRAGRVLRRWKLDELPQLWNVLRGEMSLIGPRPELEVWVRRFPAGFAPVLALRPGLTGLASVVFADEEVVLGGYTSPADAYAAVVLPRKLELERLYVRHVSPGLDLRVLGLTVLSFVDRPAATRRAEALAAALTVGRPAY
jgi:lipopolysaccharide/colanic/teichoic acid biosynthesis glycosyltransferase